MIKNKNKELLSSFTKYCEKHLEERFWQALRNWSDWPFILVDNGIENFDTFHWRTKNG